MSSPIRQRFHSIRGRALLVVALLPLLFLLWLLIQINHVVALPQPVEIEVARGASVATIGRSLQQVGVINSASLFSFYARLTGASRKIQSGFYRFEQPLSLRQVAAKLNSGDVVKLKFTVPEGLRTDEILALLAKISETPMAHWQLALEKLANGAEKEGLLLPETYIFPKPAVVEQVLAAMISAQKKVSQQLEGSWLPADKLRIVASIIEKETARDAERPLVAAVIRNRLVQGMRLQMDPTVIYGLIRTGGFSGNLHHDDMRRDTPWSTYAHSGLPPTPICNPGKASLLAAAHPAAVRYLYFVADGKGGHIFASTLEEHNRNVARWLAKGRQP